MSIELPKITELNRLKLEPGDALVVHLARHLSEKEVVELSRLLKLALGTDASIVVLEPGMRLEVLSQGGNQ